MCVVLCGMGTGNTGLGLQVEYLQVEYPKHGPKNQIQVRNEFWFFRQLKSQGINRKKPDLIGLVPVSSENLN